MHQVQIRVKGQIDKRWSEWLDGLTITYNEEGETVMSGEVLDQAALYGLIAKLRDLGLPLLAMDARASSERDDLQTKEKARSPEERINL